MPKLPPDQVSPFETDPSRRVSSNSARPGKSSVYGSGSARGPPAVAEPPPFVTVRQACALGSLGRSKLYEIMGLGLVRAIKLGTKTLIDTASLLAYLESLPTAKIRRPLKPGRNLVGPSTGATHVTPSERARSADSGLIDGGRDV
jgi:hypothetical protein